MTDKEEVKLRAVLISNDLLKGRSVLMNIQVPEEWSQYDVWFSYHFQDYGTHQRGVSYSDILIGIIGFQSFGFNTTNYKTSIGYYEQKLGVHSPYLTKLFNEVRRLIYEYNEKK